MDPAYEDFQYDNLAYRVTHPDWLRTIGRLAGLDPAPATACRVLELGCGRGANLVALASLLPESHFLGVDLAASQIADARRDADALGLTNLDLEARDLRTVPLDRGPVDYVICHGVYSWVPPEVQTAILTLTAELLSPQGIAYLSYNTLPGWYARGTLRGMLRQFVPPGPAPERAQVARRFLGVLRNHASVGLLAPWLHSEIDLLGGLSDRYLYFEHLVEDNHPCYVSDLVTRAEAAGLAYLGNADINTTPAQQLGEAGPGLVAELAADRIGAEELLDHLTMRFFRRSLLCRADAGAHDPAEATGMPAGWLATDLRPDRAGSDDAAEVVARGDTEAAPPPDTEVPAPSDAEVAAPHVVAAPTGTRTWVFRGGDDRLLRVSDPVRATALEVLADHQPQGLSLAALTREVAARLSPLPDDAALRQQVTSAMRGLLLQGQVVGGWWRRPIAPTVPARPVANPIARRQASQDKPLVTSLTHDNVHVDTLDRVLLEVLDGNRDHAALLPIVRAAQASGRLVMTVEDEPLHDEEMIVELIELKLARLRDLGLLLAPSADQAASSDQAASASAQPTNAGS